MKQLGRSQTRLRQRQRELEKALLAFEQTPAKKRGLHELFAYIVHFELLSGVIYRLRGLRGKSSASFEESLADHTSFVLSQQRAGISTMASWKFHYQQIWKREWPLFLMLCILFFASSAVGWFFGSENSEMVTAILPQSLQDLVIEKSRWFDTLKDNPLLGAFNIAINNITVCIKMVVGACLLGLGGLLLLIYNGFQIGSVCGYSYAHDFHDQLFDFILTHGPLELTMVICSAFSGLLFGRRFFGFFRPNFKEQLYEGAKDAFVVLLGIIPWLALAAFFEGFISPFAFLSFQTKILTGSFLAILFWIWTFFPLRVFNRS